MVTTGCQEAMVIALRGLCAGPDDVVLAAEPCYVGFTGAARVLGIDVVPVPESPDGLRPETVAAVAAAVRAGGRDPEGAVPGAQLRQPVRRVAAGADAAGRCSTSPPRQDLLILEDDPYGLFGLDDEPRPDAEVPRHRPAGHLPRLVRQVRTSRVRGSGSWSRTSRSSTPPAAAPCSPRNCRR